MPDILDIIFNRRSIRQFTPEPVAQETLVLLLKAAMAAPTACNSQPWEFIVVTEEETLACIRAKLPFACYNNPAAIVVCGNPKIAHNTAAREYRVMDCSAAGMGLGTVWIGIHPYASRIQLLQQTRGIPEHVIPLCMVFVGHPAEQKEPRTEYDEHQVYWQVYEPRKRRSKFKNAKNLP